MDTFETVIAPVVEKYARLVLRDEELISLALVLAWWAWSRRRQDFPPSVYARLGVRRAKQGRDLPGIKSGRKDAFLLRQVQGGAMKGLADRSPGPEKTVMWQEEYAKLLGSLTQQETELARLTIQEGITGVYELAERLGVTPGRVSQIRRSASEKL